MANKKIEIVVDVQSEQVNITSDRVLTLTEQVRLLKKEIQKAGPGKEQDLLIQKFNDVNDELDKTNLKSREFLGALGTLPGPVGMFASSLDGAVNQLRNFTSFTFTDIKTQLGGLANDFGTIFTNIGKVTGITKIYTVLNNALAKSFVAVGVGEAAATAGARAFAAALTATGIGALVILLTTAATALYEMATGEKEAARQTKALNRELEDQNRLLDLNQKAAKRRNAETIATMKAQGKSEKEIRDQINKQNFQAYTKAFKDEEDAVNLLNKNLGKANAEDLKKLQENLDKKVEARKDAYSQYIVDGRTGQATELQEQKAANQKSIDENKQRIDKINETNKAANALLIDLKRENAALLQTDERKRQDVELLNAKKGEEDRVKELAISAEKRNQILAQINEKYNLKQKDVDALRKVEDEKKRTEQLKTEEEFNRKVIELKISAMANETERSISEKENKLANDLADLELDKEFIKKSETEKAQIRKDLTTATENEVNQIRLDKAKENAEALIQLKQFQVQAETELEYSKADALAQISDILDAIAGKNKTLQITALLIQQAAAVAQILARSAVAKAGAVAAAAPLLANPLTAAAGAIALKTALTANQIATFTGLAGVALAVGTGIAKITSSGSGSQGSGGETASNSSQDLGRNYEKGGMIGGRRHAQGGTMIEAETGEAIMTRGAVTMFAPMLSMMNKMGGGTSFGNNLYVRPDAPILNNPQQEQSPMIMKTYVVSNELTSEQEKLARLKDLSTL